MSITFSVIDTSCQAADQSFFIPQVQLVTQSQTKYATLYGYSEFVPSEPPKKYHRATVTGYSTRVGFTAESTSRQCAGAKYVWSGYGRYNSLGVQTTIYSKKLFAQCSKAYWPLEPNQLNPIAINSGKGFPHRFVGYCWPTDPNSCSTCDPDENNWTFIGEQAVGGLFVDLEGFIGSADSIVQTATHWTQNDTLLGLTSLGTYVNPADPFVNPPTNQEGFPQEVINGYLGAYVNWENTNLHDCVLSSEYTDAEALANAKVVNGTGATAQNQPRTTGFTSIYTTVNYTLNLSNLVNGKDYVTTVDLWEQSPNIFEQPGISTHTLKSYSFTASGATHQITDTIAVPAATHTITVRKPTIAYAV